MKKLLLVLSMLLMSSIGYSYTVQEMSGNNEISDTIMYYSFNDEDVVPTSGVWSLKQTIISDNTYKVEYVRTDAKGNVVERKRFHNSKIVKIINQSGKASYGVKSAKNMPLIISWTVPSRYVKTGYYLNINY